MQGIISANVLPVAPVTASNKPAARARAGQTITPITDPGSFSNKAESSSDHSASWSTPCSSDASSYQPSSNHSADDKDAEPCLLAAKPPLLPKKTIVKPGSDLDKAKVKLLQQPEAVLAAANAAAHTIKYKGLSALEAQHITKVSLEQVQAAFLLCVLGIILYQANCSQTYPECRACGENIGAGLQSACFQHCICFVALGSRPMLCCLLARLMQSLHATHNLLQNQLKPDETEDEIPQAAKRQRINKVILQVGWK